MLKEKKSINEWSLKYEKKIFIRMVRDTKANKIIKVLCKMLKNCMEHGMMSA